MLLKMHTLLLAVALLVSACDYTIPLSHQRGMAIDDTLTGLWQRTTSQGTREHLLVLPLNRHEYLISFPAKAAKALYARAWSLQFAGHTFVQLRWIGTAAGTTPDNNRVYQLATFRHHGDSLEIRMLNADLISREISSSDALRKAILKHRNDPTLFRKTLHLHRS